MGRILREDFRILWEKYANPDWQEIGGYYPFWIIMTALFTLIYFTFPFYRETRIAHFILPFSFWLLELRDFLVSAYYNKDF